MPKRGFPHGRIKNMGSHGKARVYPSRNVKGGGTSFFGRATSAKPYPKLTQPYEYTRRNTSGYASTRVKRTHKSLFKPFDWDYRGNWGGRYS